MKKITKLSFSTTPGKIRNFFYSFRYDFIVIHSVVELNNLTATMFIQCIFQVIKVIKATKEWLKLMLQRLSL
jgi:hypothetical protein